MDFEKYLHLMFINVIDMITALISIFMMIPDLFHTSSEFQLPKTWSNEFTISISHSGSMSGGSFHARFTHDSCYYQSISNEKGETKRSFALTEAERNTILKALLDFKVDKIHSETSLAPVHDGWSQMICFDFYCISGGTSAIMSQEDKGRFLETYQYLEDVATNKAKR